MKKLFFILLLTFSVTIFGQVNLLSPADDALTQPTGVTLDWDPVAGANLYRITVTDGITPNQYTTAMTAYGIGGLTLNTVYDWSVEASDDNGLTYNLGSSATWSFRVRLATASLVAPANFSAGNSIQPLLDWDAVADADEYDLEVASDAAFLTIIYSATLSDTEFDFETINNLLTNGAAYYWRVNARNTTTLNESDFQSAYKFWVTSAITPVLSSPIGGDQLFSNPVQLSWYLNQAAGNETYDVFYGTTPVGTYAGTTPVVTGLTDKSYTMPTLTAGTTYYWQVRSKTASGAIAGYSSVESFITPGTLLVPVLTWPDDMNTVYTNDPYLNWYLNGPGYLLKYQVRYAEDPSTDVDGQLDDLSAQNYPSLINGFNVQLLDLDPGQTYYWQVRSTNDNGVTFSAWSAAEGFLTEGEGFLYVPVPSYPSLGDIVYNTAPTLYWYVDGPSFGLTYDINYSSYPDVDVNGVLNNNPVYVEDIADSYLALNNLTNGSDYYWQVRSRNSSATSDWSTVEEFTVYSVNTTPPTPNPSYPIGAETVYSNSPYLYYYIDEWMANLEYEVRYSSTDVTDGNGKLTAGLSLALTTDGYIQLNGLSTDATYYWQVRSTNDGGTTYSSWSVVESFYVDPGQVVGPVVPVPSWPIDGEEVFDTTPQLSWYLNEAAAGLEYQVLYATDPGTSGGVLTNGTVSTAWISNRYIELPALVPGATYYWQVRSRVAANPGDVSAYSSVEDFSINASNGPVVPLPGSPVAGVEIQSNSPAMSWLLPISTGGNLLYELELSNSPDMSNSMVINNISGKSNAIPNLSNGQKYYWRVRSYNTSGVYSFYSPMGSFRIAGVTGVEEEILPEEFSVQQNYPNPFNPTTNIRFAIPSDARVSVKIYNSLGQEVKTLLNSDLTRGYHSLVWNGDNDAGSKVSSGAYLYKVTAGNYSETKKMVLLR
ncbi:MAG: T9SS type A sorting domain-containing protein [Ignavibacteriales bacterium]|nr:T9SS type A sorting domain-containing protein [Ignavibacteriales bacterium]MCF8435816.1 T9SS type A sorting domain-containing protein [Ignavibacteriales bacterium]